MSSAGLPFWSAACPRSHGRTPAPRPGSDSHLPPLTTPRGTTPFPRAPQTGSQSVPKTGGEGGATTSKMQTQDERFTWQIKSSREPAPSLREMQSPRSWRGCTGEEPRPATEGPSCIPRPLWAHSHRHPVPRPLSSPRARRRRLHRTLSFHLRTGREAARGQQMGPPSAPRPLAKANARARGIPGAAEASPSWALSVRALHPKGS